MCGRFVVKIDQRDLEDIAKAVRSNAASNVDLMTLKLDGEISPTDIVPVKTADGLRPMRWGFRLPKRTIINARSETVMEKPMFREAIARQRCVICASGYFEWTQELSGKKTKHQFHLPAHEQLHMAGCYRIEQDSTVPSFVILTKSADSVAAEFHDRMPVVLTSQQADAWLHSPDLDINEIIRNSMTNLIHTPSG
jgi:putative SOS response-associated peptidase YedK